MTPTLSRFIFDEPICAWCVRAGLIDDVPDASHGICTWHLAIKYPEEEAA